MLFFTLYVTRGPLSFERCAQILSLLWKHGINLGPSMPQDTTWENLLPVGAKRFTDSTLQKRIELVLSTPSLPIVVYDRTMQMEIYFDTDLRNLAVDQDDPAVLNDLPYGIIELVVRKLYLHEDTFLPEQSIPDLPSQAYVLSPYQMVHYAIDHWAKILCEGLNPFFGFSYHDGDYRDDESGFSESKFVEFADRTFMGALLKGQQPPLEEWLTTPEIIYTAAPNWDATLLQKWLSQRGRQVEMLANGGLFSVAYDVSGDTARALELSTLGDTARKGKRFAEAKAYFLRAKTIYEGLPDKRMVAHMEVSLRGLPQEPS